jgi:hypothetical protein
MKRNSGLTIVLTDAQSAALRRAVGPAALRPRRDLDRNRRIAVIAAVATAGILAAGVTVSAWWWLPPLLAPDAPPPAAAKPIPSRLLDEDIPPDDDER